MIPSAAETTAAAEARYADEALQLQIQQDYQVAMQAIQETEEEALLVRDKARGV